MTEDKRKLLIENTARNIGPVTKNIKYRHATHCFLADEDYGKRMVSALGIDMDTVIVLSKLSHEERRIATFNDME